MAINTVVDAHSGPAWALVGDPTQAAGAGMVELGEQLSASVQLKVWRQTTKNELGQILPDGAYGVIQGATIELQMLKVSAAHLAAIINEVSDETSWIGADTALGTLTPFTIVIVPDHAKTAGTSLTNLATQWIPKAVMTNVTPFLHRLEKGGTDDDSNPYTATFEALLAPTDQADTALDAKAQIWFKGDPAGPMSSATPAWSLPSGY